MGVQAWETDMVHFHRILLQAKAMSIIHHPLPTVTNTIWENNKVTILINSHGGGMMECFQHILMVDVLLQGMKLGNGNKG